MKRKRSSDFRKSEIIEILKEADVDVIVAVAQKHGVSASTIYRWRRDLHWPAVDLATKNARSGRRKAKRKPRVQVKTKASPKVKAAPKTKATRRVFTDPQKRLMLRAAADTSPAKAAARFKVNSSLFSKWKQSGLRPARKASSSRRAVVARKAKRANGNHPTLETVRPVAGHTLGDLQTIATLREQLGQALAEASELSQVVIEQTLENRRLRAQS